MKKYAISREFFPWNLFAPPISEKFLAMSVPHMKPPKSLWRDKELDVTTHEIESYDGRNITCFVLSPKKLSAKAPCLIYLHGGGFICGNADYAKGFGITLAVRFGVKVFCPAYRLAPENPAPAALEDALTAYCYLLEKGYSSRHITLCGESAGGGLCYALAMKLREKNMPMPAGIIAISPWVDLTASGTSYIENEERDPSLSKERLQFYASLYVEDKKDPYVSPIFGDFHGMPPSLIFVGGDEVMLSDAETLYQKLTEAGCSAKLQIKPGMWHAYILYGTKESKSDFAMILEFLKDFFPQTDKNTK